MKYDFDAEFVEVRIHRRTQEIRVPRIVGAFAGGRIMNTRTARSQLMGGMSWGISSALHEVTEFDRRNAPVLNRYLQDYLKPRLTHQMHRLPHSNDGNCNEPTRHPCLDSSRGRPVGCGGRITPVHGIYRSATRLTVAACHQPVSSVERPPTQAHGWKKREAAKLRRDDAHPSYLYCKLCRSRFSSAWWMEQVSF